MFTDVTSWTAKLRDRPEAGLGDQKDGPRAWHAAREIRFSAGWPSAHRPFSPGHPHVAGATGTSSAPSAL